MTKRDSAALRTCRWSAGQHQYLLRDDRRTWPDSSAGAGSNPGGIRDKLFRPQAAALGAMRFMPLIERSCWRRPAR